MKSTKRIKWKLLHEIQVLLARMIWWYERKKLWFGKTLNFPFSFIIHLTSLTHLFLCSIYSHSNKSRHFFIFSYYLPFSWQYDDDEKLKTEVVKKVRKSFDHNHIFMKKNCQVHEFSGLWFHSAENNRISNLKDTLTNKNFINLFYHRPDSQEVESIFYSFYQ